MKVKDLVAKLLKEDQEAILIVQKDSEGNGYSPLAGIDTGMYQQEDTWYGEFGYGALTDELIAQGYTEEDIIDGEAAVVLYPIN